MKPYTDRKVIFLGDVGVGKSSIICRLMHNTIESSYSSTVGIDYLTKTVYKNSQILKVHFWDTAGQEKFKSLMPSYIRNCSVAVIVYDLGCQASFNSLKSWVSLVKEQGPNIEIVVVGNKIDLTREVDEKEAKVYASEILAAYVESSAKTGEGIDSIYKKIFLVLPDVQKRRGQALDTKTKNNKSCGCI